MLNQHRPGVVWLGPCDQRGRVAYRLAGRHLTGHLRIADQINLPRAELFGQRFDVLRIDRRHAIEHHHREIHRYIFSKTVVRRGFERSMCAIDQHDLGRLNTGDRRRRERAIDLGIPRLDQHRVLGRLTARLHLDQARFGAVRRTVQRDRQRAVLLVSADSQLP